MNKIIPKNTTKAGDEKGMVTTYQFLLNKIGEHFPGGRDTSTKAERLAAWKAEKALEKAAAASPASSPVSTSPTNNQMDVKMDMDSYDGPPLTMQVATELGPHGFMTVPLPPPAHSLPSPRPAPRPSPLQTCQI